MPIQNPVSMMRLSWVLGIGVGLLFCECFAGWDEKSRGGGYCTGLEFEIESIVTAEL